jgi:hypothetical protein
MHQLSELILLTDVHGLNLWVTFSLVQDASEPTLDLTRAVQLEEAVVQQGRQPLGEVAEASVDGLLLLQVQVVVGIQDQLVEEVRVGKALDDDVEVLILLVYEEPMPVNLVALGLLAVEGNCLNFHGSKNV